ncbi:MAG: hypothetical protein P4M11_11880 [Candidatus Pacebacteria bacterium]|nr:hypothetical protein [Candidatus Paceibacterota bacterium]
MFAMYLAGYDGTDSEVTLGGYNTDRTGDNPFYWESLPDSSKWAVAVKSITVGDAVISSPKNMLLNSAEEYMIMSKSSPSLSPSAL